MRYFDVVIVGAGHAGAQAAISLRQAGFKGSVAMIGDEPDPPYERPPLSKEYLAGDKSFDRILIRPPAFWSERAIAMMLGMRAHTVDPVGKVVTVGEETIAYGKLIWAAGGSARRLTCEGADAANVHGVRRRADVDAILATLDEVDHATVIGGGYIGLEAAAILTRLGKRVVLLEALDRVLARVAGPELSRFYEVEHRAHGVDVRLGTTIRGLETNNGRASAVLVEGGDRIETGMVIVGIGIVPEVDALTAAGAAVGNGVEVDEFCRTSLPDIFAVGDCAAHANRFARGSRIRLESVQNAHDQAKVAAAHLLGKHEPYDAVPWFWSNQYDLKLQTVGLSMGYDQAVLRGDPATRSFSVLYLRDERLIALDCVNSVKDYVQGRSHVIANSRLDLDLASDPAIALKDIPQASS